MKVVIRKRYKSRTSTNEKLYNLNSDFGTGLCGFGLGYIRTAARACVSCSAAAAVLNQILCINAL